MKLTNTQVQLLRDIQSKGMVTRKYFHAHGHFSDGSIVMAMDLLMMPAGYIKERKSEEDLMKFYALGKKAITYLSTLDNKDNG